MIEVRLRHILDINITLQFLNSERVKMLHGRHGDGLVGVESDFELREDIWIEGAR